MIYSERAPLEIGLMHVNEGTLWHCWTNKTLLISIDKDPAKAFQGALDDLAKGHPLYLRGEGLTPAT